MLSFLKQWNATKRESDQLIEMIRASFPLDREGHFSGSRIPKKSAAAVRKVVGSASAFAGTTHAGLFSRAHLANRVKWGLKDLGYADPFVDEITSSIIVAMGHAPRVPVWGRSPKHGSADAIQAQDR
jgi:hypothetical protein